MAETCPESGRARRSSVRSVRRRMAALAILAGVCLLAFVLYGTSGQWDFVVSLRARRAATLVLVGFAIAVSTVMFQTATENRILTPAIMGFDSLYVLIQSCTLFFFGMKSAMAINPLIAFWGQVGIMVLFAVGLHWALFVRRALSLHVVILAGVVLGVMFRSLSSFVQRVINPSEFAFIQDRFFASFNNPDPQLLGMSALAVLGACLWCLPRIREMDVLTLGRDRASSLGVQHKKSIFVLFAAIATLTSVSTALVGPVTFFGLLVSHLAYRLFPTHRHMVLLPAAALIAVVTLVGGQFILERTFSFSSNLRVIVDFLGGVTFLLLLVRKGAR